MGPPPRFAAMFAFTHGTRPRISHSRRVVSFGGGSKYGLANLSCMTATVAVCADALHNLLVSCISNIGAASDMANSALEGQTSGVAHTRNPRSVRSDQRGQGRKARRVQHSFGKRQPNWAVLLGHQRDLRPNSRAPSAPIRLRRRLSSRDGSPPIDPPRPTANRRRSTYEESFRSFQGGQRQSRSFQTGESVHLRQYAAGRHWANPRCLRPFELPACRDVGL